MVLLRSEVKEWILPAPLTVSGEAGVSFSCIPDVRVAVTGVGSADIAGVVLASARGLGVAEVAGTGEVQLLPRPMGLASLSLDGTGSTIRDFALRVAGAEVSVSASAGVSVAALGQAGVLAVLEARALAPQVGSAEVVFEYYGNGDTPIFPFSLPFLFLPEGFDNGDAAAFVDVEGDGVAVVACDGGAEVPASLGEVELVVFGTNPVFPFQFPIVFNSLGVIRRAEAELSVSVSGVVVVPVLGDAGVGVVCSADLLTGSVFPDVLLPFVFSG